MLLTVLISIYFSICTQTNHLLNTHSLSATGEPIPKRQLPPLDRLDYYTDPKFRGYLADPDQIAVERLKLAQKYGYKLPELKEDDNSFVYRIRKDPRQIFFGLQPGWVVNLKDKEILAPEDTELVNFYNN